MYIRERELDYDFAHEYFTPEDCPVELYTQEESEEFDRRFKVRFGRSFMDDIDWQLANIFAPRHNEQAIEETIRVFHREGDIFEICIIPNRSGGYFDNPQLAAQLIYQHGAGAKGCYFIPNAIKRDAVGSLNTWHWSRGATKDADIERRRWLLIDADPTRPADTSSTVAEKREAFRIIANIGQLLKSEGVEMSMRGDSGNGWHDNIPIDAPNDEESKLIVQDLLKGFNKRYSNSSAKVDTTVYNASRIWKLYGTVACKGESTSERPHRTSILDIPLGTISEEVRINNWHIIKSLVERWRFEDKPPDTPKPIVINELATPSIPEVASNDFDYYRAQRYAQQFPGSISGQGGSNNTLTLACRLVQDFRQSRENAYTILYEQHNPKCIPCWSERELWHKVDSAISKIEPDKLGCKLSSTSGEALVGASQLVPELNERGNDSPEWVPFPVHTMPHTQRVYIENLANRMGVDVSMPATLSGAHLSGVVGTCRKVKLMEGWRPLPCCEWIALIAPSGSCKSPVLGALDKPIKEKNAELIKINKRLKKEFKAKEEAWLNKKSYTSQKSKDKLDMSLLDEEKPEEPKYERVCVEDGTLEVVETILEDNPSGLVCTMHELDSLFNALTRHSKVDLGGIYTNFYDGYPRTIDRLGRGTVLLENPVITFAGAVQMEVIAKHLTDERYAQGFGSRFTLVKPPIPKRKLIRNHEPIEGENEWNDLIEKLIALRKSPSKTLQVSDEPEADFCGKSALDLYEEFHNNLEYQRDEGKWDALRSKTQDRAYRRAGLHAIITHIEQGDEQVNSPIRCSSMQAGIEYALWAMNETIRVHQLLEDQKAANLTETALKWLKSLPNGGTARELSRKHSGLFPHHISAEGALGDLVAQGLATSLEYVPASGGTKTVRYSPK